MGAGVVEQSMGEQCMGRSKDNGVKTGREGVPDTGADGARVSVRGVEDQTVVGCGTGLDEINSAHSDGPPARAIEKVNPEGLA